MAVQTSMPHLLGTSVDHPNSHHRSFDTMDETEEDLIENYRFLTQHCGVLRQSRTVNVISSITRQPVPSTTPSHYSRPFSSISECSPNKNTSVVSDQYAYLSSKTSFSPLLSSMQEKETSSRSRIPPTIYYDDPIDHDLNGHHKYRSFSLMRLFTRMKTHLKHERRYHPEPHHQLLTEEDPQEWYELTKNVRAVLTKALLPDGGYDASVHRSHHRNSSKKSREQVPVLSKEFDDENKIQIDIDPVLSQEEEEKRDQAIREKFLSVTRGFHYRRNGVCKAIDRQFHQGQLVYVYGVANNILIDENLRASGLG